MKAVVIMRDGSLQFPSPGRPEPMILLHIANPLYEVSAALRDPNYDVQPHTKELCRRVHLEHGWAVYVQAT